MKGSNFPRDIWVLVVLQDVQDPVDADVILGLCTSHESWGFCSIHGGFNSFVHSRRLTCNSLGMSFIVVTEIGEPVEKCPKSACSSVISLLIARCALHKDRTVSIVR